MTKAICRRILLVSLILPALQSWTHAAGPDKSNPDMGFQVASNAPALVQPGSSSKLDKLNDTIRQAAEEYKQGRFDQAAKWYGSALQLEPDRKDLQQSLANARQMQDAQLKANAQLPRDPREREKFLAIAFEQAQQYAAHGKFPQASQAFYKLWLTAGDYQGKTLVAYQAAQQQVEAARKSTETTVASAAPVAAAAPAAVSSKASGEAEVLLDEVVPPHADGPALVVSTPASSPKVATPAVAPSSPSAIEADLNKARAAIKTGYYDDAQRILQDVLTRDPNNTAARAELAKMTAISENELRRATAKANWQTQEHQVAQLDAPANGTALKPVYAAGAEAASTTATLQPVTQSTPTPTPTPAPAAAETAPLTAQEAQVTTASEGALLPAGASATGGPTGGAAESGAGVTSTSGTTEAPVSVGGEVDDLARLQANRLLRQAELLAGEGKTQDATKAVRQSLEIWPDNPRAQALLKQYSSAAGAATAAQDATPPLAEKSALEQKGGTAAEIQDRSSLGHQLDELHKRALEYYDAGDLGKSREIWNQMLQLDPGNKLAHTWLENTTEAYQRLQADKQTRTDIEARSDAAQKLLSSPVTISTDRRIPLPEFMNALSYVTPVGLQYYIAQGAEANVFANFVNKPLREVLDTVLLPIGLTWSIDEKNVITIKPKLISRTYKLSAQQLSQVRALLDAGNLQRIIWGQTEKPAPGLDITLDERQNVLVVTGSDLHIKKVDNFLPTLQVAQGSDLEMKIYKIRPEDGPRIKALINSIIQASPDTPFSLERKIFVDGEDLIIRDTPENITKIEELLTNKKFIQKLHDETLDILNFSLVPKDVENVQSDQVQSFTARVVEAIQVFLYNTDGIAKAREDGRRMWFDDATLQLTVVDTPTNLQRVSEYIESLPELRQRSLQKVRFLKYALAEDLSSSLLRILDLTGGDTGGESNNGEEAVFKLRRGEERQFRNTRIRVLRVEQNDVEDRNDDSVEVTLSVPGTGPQNQTIQELDSVVTDDYEITAEDVLPSSGNPGEGSARLRIRYVPQGLSREELAAQATATGTGTGAKSTLDEAGISINPFGDLNALIIRYTNPGLYKDVEDLILQLDQPTKQVEIETKFVQVNESRAKEFSSDFDFSGLGSGNSIDWSDSMINSRFAQDVDEYRDAYSPSIENPLNANLIKGTTVISAIFGSVPGLQYNLRLLEAEGIVNVVNGPKVLSLNGEEAEFRIETSIPNSTTNTGGQTTSVDSTGSGLTRSLTVSNPLADALDDVEVADTDEATPGDGGLAGAVILRMTPSITSENSIILRELTAELLDFDGYLSEYATRSVTDDTGSNGGLVMGSKAVVQGSPIIKRKKIITYARIRNGGTIVIGGWTGEHSEEYSSGIPVLRNMPYIGKLLFSRNQRTSDRTTLLIFLTGFLVD